MSRTDTHTDPIHLYDTEEMIPGHLVIVASDYEWATITKHYAKPRAAKSLRRQIRSTLRQAERAYTRTARFDSDANDSGMYRRGVRNTIMWDLS